jgi:hypothetical protein
VLLLVQWKMIRRSVCGGFLEVNLDWAHIGLGKLRMLGEDEAAPLGL